jgi:hypothetical protein
MWNADHNNIAAVMKFVTHIYIYLGLLVGGSSFYRQHEQ